jgi:hypothetical protein
MEKSPSWKTNSFSADQEIPHILCNPNAHYRVSQNPATCPNHEPDQSNPHHHSISLHSILISSPIYVAAFQVSLSFRFPHQGPVCTIRATYFAHLILLDLITRSVIFISLQVSIKF